jgi:hypothetical protein
LIKRKYGEPLIILLLAAVAATTSLRHLQQTGLGEFYQMVFSPAVTWACTGRFENLDLWRTVAPPPQLAAVFAFLDSKTGTFDCSVFPPLSEIKLSPFDSLQIQTLYLIGAVAALWAIIGISWSAVFILAVLFTVLLVLAVYGICRLFLPIWWALAASLAVALSPLLFLQLPHLRDYAKAPFILGIIFLGGRLMLSIEDSRRTMLVAALAGLCAGVGFGVRADLALAVPFFALVLVLAAASTGFRAYRAMVLGAGAFALAFIAAALPVLAAYRGGGLIGHVTLLGLATHFNPILRLTDTVYDIGHLYLDQYVAALIQAYAFQHEPMTGVRPQLHWLGPDYGSNSIRVLVDYAWHFPADVLIRGYASILQTLRLDYIGLPEIEFSRYRIRQHGPVLAFLAVAVVGASRPRLAAFLALAIVFFAGSGALQFGFRHLFYLEFVYWLSAAVLLAWLVDLAIRAAVAGRRSLGATRALLGREAGLFARGLLFPAAALAVALLLLVLTRTYQQAHVERLINAYLAAPRVPVAIQEQAIGPDILLRPVGTMPDMSGASAHLDEIPLNGFYLVAVFDRTRCNHPTVPVTVAYHKQNAYEDFSRTVTMPMQHDGPARLVFPTMSCNGICGRPRFLGVSVPADRRSCVAGLEAVAGFKSLPLPLWLRLAPDWSRSALYQQRTAR